MNVFLWHVHGSWTTAFVQGPHTYYFPVLPDRGPDGRGRAQTWTWPPNAIEVDEEQAAALSFDVVIYQRPHEPTIVHRWLGDRVPGRDLPALYVEHNAPRGDVPNSRHHLADRSDVTLVHVTHFNELFWDAGTTATRVIEHAIVDPGYRYSGDLRRTAVVINEPGRRGRVTGTDLLPRLRAAAPVDLFGMGAAEFGGVDDLPQAALHEAMALRRAYAHPIRWTSLGLSLLEAMYLGMPVVAVASTEAPVAVPPCAGTTSTNVDELVGALRTFQDHPRKAREAGRCARDFALSRFHIERFHRDWDTLLAEVRS
jgi:hypothetical protein